MGFASMLKFTVTDDMHSCSESDLKSAGAAALAPLLQSSSLLQKLDLRYSNVTMERRALPSK
jgi:hypothetical protein